MNAFVNTDGGVRFEATGSFTATEITVDYTVQDPDGNRDVATITMQMPESIGHPTGIRATIRRLALLQPTTASSAIRTPSWRSSSSWVMNG